MGVYLSYIKAIGLKFCVVIASAFLVFTLITIVNNYWLSLWSDDAKCLRNRNQSVAVDCGASTGVRLGVYVGLGLSQGTTGRHFY